MPEAPTPTPARVWGDQWLRVSEMVLRGLNHQLSNRVASIEAVASLIDPQAPDPNLLQSIHEDVSKLGALMQLYRMLPAEHQSRLEPVRLQDLAPQVLELHAYHADLRGIGCELTHDPLALPIFVRPSALLRVLLVLLENAAGETRRAGQRRTVRLSYGGDAREVWMVLEGDARHEEKRARDGLVDASRATLRHARATVACVVDTDEPPALRYEIRLPTLPEVRRLEQEGL